MRKTWTVRVSRDAETTGESIWRNCPFADGVELFVDVVELPLVAVRIGDYKSRKPKVDPGPGPLGLPGPPQFVNGPLLSLGPYPGPHVPLRRGCDINIVPAWEQFGGPPYSPIITANMVAPTYGSNEGVDCQSLDEVQIWAGTLHPTLFDSLRIFPWVRHPSGVWGQPEGSGAPASGPGRQVIVNTRDADRVYGQVVFTTPITAIAVITYGRLTSPPLLMVSPTVSSKAPPVHVRFGAVEAP